MSPASVSPAAAGPDEPVLGPIIERDGTRTLVGTCSWADASLVKDADWYPRRSMKAAERLAFYASRFPLVEVDSTYYFPPTPELATNWADRTPDGFTFDVKAWSLLTGHPTFPHSLWEDLQGEVKPEFRDKRNIYDKHLTDEALGECWHRFRHSLSPLHQAGKLGAVLLQWPPWFGPKGEHCDRILEAVAMLAPYRCLIEFRNARWLSGEQCENTLGWLEANGLTFVCVDEPQGFASSIPPVVASTAALAVVRFHGHNAENWEARGITEAERFKYLYDDNELDTWAKKLRELEGTADELHVLWNNCWQDFGVTNAQQMIDRLRRADPGNDPAEPNR